MRNHGWDIMQPQTSKIVHYWYFTNHTETLAANNHRMKLPWTCRNLQEWRIFDHLECVPSSYLMFGQTERDSIVGWFRMVMGWKWKWYKKRGNSFHLRFGILYLLTINFYKFSDCLQLHCTDYLTMYSIHKIQNAS